MYSFLQIIYILNLGIADLGLGKWKTCVSRYMPNGQWNIFTKKEHVSLSYADVCCNITSNHATTKTELRIDNRIQN